MSSITILCVTVHQPAVGYQITVRELLFRRSRDLVSSLFGPCRRFTPSPVAGSGVPVFVMGQPCGEHVVVELIVLRVGLSTCIAKI